MTLMDNSYWNPPVDAMAYYSDAQTVTSDGLATNIIDHKAAGCFPASAYFVIEPFTIDSGEQMIVTFRQSANANLGTPDDLWSKTFSSSLTERMLVPLSNTIVTKRYTGVHYDVTTSDSIPVTSYLAPAA